MYRLQKVDFQNIRLQDRPGGWLAGDFPFDAEKYAGEEELKDFLLENPSILLDMATNLFYYRELGLSMTKMFYIFEEVKQNPQFLSYMNSLFERISAWYEVDETGMRYLLIQGEGISENCIQMFDKLKQEKKLDPMIQRLYIDSHFSDDVKVSGYYYLEKASEEEEDMESDSGHMKLHIRNMGLNSGDTERDSRNLVLLRQLMQESDFRDYGSINVSGLSIQELEKEPILKELLNSTDQLYLYVFDLCIKQSGEKVKKYVKILRWNVER